MNMFTGNCCKDENKEERGRKWTVFSKLRTMLPITHSPSKGHLDLHLVANVGTMHNGTVLTLKSDGSRLSLSCPYQYSRRHYHSIAMTS